MFLQNKMPIINNKGEASYVRRSSRRATARATERMAAIAESEGIDDAAFLQGKGQSILKKGKAADLGVLDSLAQEHTVIETQQIQEPGTGRWVNLASNAGQAVVERARREAFTESVYLANLQRARGNQDPFVEAVESQILDRRPSDIGDVPIGIDG